MVLLRLLHVDDCNEIALWCNYMLLWGYRQVSNIRRTLVGNKIVDHSDVDGASPVDAAPTTSSFSTWHLAFGKESRKAVRESFKC